MSAAAELFVRDGYEKTSVNGIVEKAGCSVGAFYGLSNRAGAGLAVWPSPSIEIIKESVEKGSRIKEFDAFIDYLIMRSISSYSNKLTNVLFKHISYTAEVRSNMAQWAARYTGMIRNMLHQYAPEASEDAVWSYASIIHAILNSHAQKFSEQATYLFFSDDVLKEAIYALMEACKNSSN